MKFILDRSKIRPLDIGFSSDRSFFAFVEKWTINGFLKAATDSKQKLPVHVLQFVEIFGHIKILEMVVDNNDHKKMKLTLTSIEKYEDNGFFGDRIICIKRNSLYDDPAIRKRANDRHLARWSDGNTFYDVAELTFFIPFLRFLGLKNDNTKLVCSSETESELNADGYTYTNFPLLNIDGTPKNPPGVISPFDIMSAKFVSNFKGNRFDFSELTGIYKQ